MYPIYILLIVVIIGLAVISSWAFENSEERLGCLCIMASSIATVVLTILLLIGRSV